MKVLILATMRSGSTSLLYSIAESLKAEYLFEPFHTEYDKSKYFDQFDKIKSSDNLVVKIIDNHFYNFSEFLDYKNLTKYFDKVIGLTRENDVDSANSAYLATVTGAWFNYSKFHISDVKINKEEYDLMLSKIIKDKKEILSFDIFQVTYEGIYKRKDQVDALKKYLGFDF